MYVLEHAGDFVRAHALKPDDVIGLSSADVRRDGALWHGRLCCLLLLLLAVLPIC